MFLFKPIAIDLCLDVGTANTIVHAEKRGYVVNQPSYIAMESDGEVVALGSKAKKMMGKTVAAVNVVRPLADGVLADFDAGDAMIKGFIKAAKIPKFRIGKVLMSVPTNITGVEKTAMIASAKSAGAKQVYLVAEPMAAAIGAGLDVKGEYANMIVDIGGGTTDIAVINYGGIVVDNTIRIAGDEVNTAIVEYFRKEYNMKIGEITAEKLKMQFVDLAGKSKARLFAFKTLDHVTGKAKKVEFPVQSFQESYREVIDRIVAAIRHVLEILPPELSSDILDRGILFTGGGALLTGLDTMVRDTTNLHVTKPENPLYTVAEGTRKIMSRLKYYRDILV